MDGPRLLIGVLHDYPAADGGAAFEWAVRRAFDEVAATGRLPGALEMIHESAFGLPLPGGSARSVEDAFRRLVFLKDAIVRCGQQMPDVGVPLAQLAIAWCLKNPHVSTVITGATRPAQVQENLAAAAILSKLTDEVMARIEAILGNKPARRSM